MVPSGVYERQSLASDHHNTQRTPQPRPRALICFLLTPLHGFLGVLAIWIALGPGLGKPDIHPDYP